MILVNKRKTLVILATLSCLSFAMVLSVRAQNNLVYVEDQECVKYEVLTGNTSLCNQTCVEDCINNDMNCKSGKPDECFSISSTSSDFIQEEIREALNFFGINLCTPDNPDCIPSLVRLVFLGVLSLFGAAGAFVGVWAAYLRSIAQTAEAIAAAFKTATNAFIGLAIGFGGIIIVQLVSMLTGNAQGVFDFNIFPPVGAGEECFLTEGERCIPAFQCDNSQDPRPGVGKCTPIP